MTGLAWFWLGFAVGAVSAAFWHGAKQVSRPSRQDCRRLAVRLAADLDGLRRRFDSIRPTTNPLEAPARDASRLAKLLND